MELKEYQRQASERIDTWLKELDRQRALHVESSDGSGRTGNERNRARTNYPKSAWYALRRRDELPKSVLETPKHYASRKTKSGQPVAHACLKIPTGGGKTLMGVVAVRSILMRKNEQTGLVLWVVPNKAIYDQTRASLRNRDHPYRRMLDIASNGRVKILKKDDPFTQADVDTHLCIMLLTLQSSNRSKNKNFLKINRSSGAHSSFFPDVGNTKAEQRFLQEHPALTTEGGSETVKHSLMNAIRISRPIVILDEAHKAYGANKKKNKKIARTINRLEPEIVIELSATPDRRFSNVLVDVSGTSLHVEEMIKLPIEVHTPPESEPWSWQHTLRVAHERLDQLAKAARKLEDTTGRYIRPIAVVRCERTAKAQLGSDKIHIEDVRSQLIAQGVPPNEIRVKTSEMNELAGINLNDKSDVRWILTRDALKEGWDCPFAYVLVLLDEIRARVAVTQMVGRVLRMPQVAFTGVDALDRCYVYCHSLKVRESVDLVRGGLESEGLAGLEKWIVGNGGVRPSKLAAIPFERRPEHSGTDVYLPRVLRKLEDGSLRELRYSQDILANLQWSKLEIAKIEPIKRNPPTGRAMLVHAEDERTQEIEIDYGISDEDDLVYFSKHFSSIIPNPWVSASLAERAMTQLIEEDQQCPGEISRKRSLYAAVWREDLCSQVDQLACDVFMSMLIDGSIEFSVDAHQENYKMAFACKGWFPDDVDWFDSPSYPVQRSLFKPVVDVGFNALEREFAWFLDGHDAMQWWHRVAVNQSSGYFLKGWRPGRVIPDFVALARAEKGPSGKSGTRLLLLETKGKQLKGNDDTQYKQALFEILQQKLNGHAIGKGVSSLNSDGEPAGFVKMIFEGELDWAFDDTDIDTS